MAIYSTFFLSKPEELPDGFPGWRAPLPEPVRREFKNPFTGQMSTIETREPEWPDGGGADAVDRDFEVVPREGSYEGYLEGRLPPFVRARPHWAAKGLTEIELEVLAQAIGVISELAYALYSPPSSAAVLRQIPREMLSTLLALDQQGLEAVAHGWAAAMSTPEFTHSTTGIKLSEGWSASEALDVLGPIVALGRKASVDQRMYLLIEV